ncbi:MAG TPA: hypothetical protein VEK07_00180 [Polyangiaceae bacterium]|nr:hypothetical protein [Polyangiaceae bacterium]
MSGMTEERERTVARVRQRILALLGDLTASERRLVVATLRLDVAGMEDDAPSAGRTVKPSPAKQETKVYAETAGTLVRKVFQQATAWLTTSEVLAEVRKVDPNVEAKRVYATINKMANKGTRKLARHGEPPSVRYATLENAEAWGEPKSVAWRLRVNGSAEKRGSV